MNLLNTPILYISFYLILATIFTQSYKVATKTLTKPGTLTVLLELIGVVTSLLLWPLFEIKFPNDIKIYLLLGLSILFYAITDRINTTVRSGIEASTFTMLKQLATAFMIFAGLLFLKEEIVLTQFIGAMLIIVSNVFLFFQKGNFQFNRYILLGILANIAFAIALFLDVNISDHFNLPFYVAMTLGIPAILITLLEKIKLADIKSEWKNGNQKAILVTGMTWSLSIVSQLRAYQLGNVTVVAPLCALTVILNVIFGYLFLQEKDHLVKKIIAAILIIFSIFLIKI